MATIEPPIEIRSWGSERVVALATTEEAMSWAGIEREFWATAPGMETLPNNLKQYWQAQTNAFSVISNAVAAFDKVAGNNADNEEGLRSARNALNQQIGKTLESLRQGRVLTSEHPAIDDVMSLAKRDIAAAVILLVANYSNGRDVLQSLFGSGHFPYDVFVRTAFATNETPQYEEALALRRKNLAELANSLTSELSGLRSDRESLSQSFSDFEESQTNAAGTRVEDWTQLLQRVEDEWKNRLKAYDEKMALAAPTSYWQKRAKVSMATAAAYAVIFVGIISIALWQFEQYAIPYLAAAAVPGVPILTAVLPVLVPAFAVIWILRILGRLLAESIQLMQDARERSTMVMTFLALMNDEVRGKTLVTDDDRLLILHSLFRPSAVSATDDAPPVNWFDILSRKFGGPDRK